MSEHNIICDYGMMDYWFHYKKSIKYKKFQSNYSPNNPLIVDRKTYVRIINSLHEKIVQKALNGDVVHFPHNFGTLSIRKKKMKFNAHNRLRLNYEHYKKTGQKVYHLNENRNYYYYKWFWKKFSAKIPTKTYYKLKPTRYCTRTLAGILKNTDKDYLELIKNKRIYID